MGTLLNKVYVHEEPPNLFWQTSWGVNEMVTSTRNEKLSNWRHSLVSADRNLPLDNFWKKYTVDVNTQGLLQNRVNFNSVRKKKLPNWWIILIGLEMTAQSCWRDCIMLKFQTFPCMMNSGKKCFGKQQIQRQMMVLSGQFVTKTKCSTWWMKVTT